MAIPTRRASARLSGGSANGDLAFETLDFTRKKRNSANGTVLVAEGVVDKPDVGEGTRKRQRTGDVR
jgi:hypothetical protein